MQTSSLPLDTKSTSPRLVLSLASSPAELREVQRLRYKVFIDKQGLSALANPERLDRDEFDEFCDHLIVRESVTLKVVGTYRVLGPSQARRAGRYYSENEFDLSRLDHLRGRMVEAGRACIHPDYRGGSVIMLLWAGLAEYMRRERCDFLIGCASISVADGGANATAVVQSLFERHASPLEYRVTPHLPFPLRAVDPELRARVPALIKGYLRSGAWICGAPAWDPDFDSADVFLLLTLGSLDSRYAKHYGMD